MLKVTAKAWNPETRKADLPVEYEARNRQEAINWIKFNRQYMRDFAIDGEAIYWLGSERV